jgi:acyl carrier protein
LVFGSDEICVPIDPYFSVGVGQMTGQEILRVFTGILRDVLLDDSIVLSMETRRQDVPNWDSFNYINFMVAVEIKFGLKFKVADIESFENVGAIVAETKALLE